MYVYIYSLIHVYGCISLCKQCMVMYLYKYKIQHIHRIIHNL